MVNRITDKQKEEAWRMYKQGGIINNIAKYVSVSYHSAWVMTKGRKRGFKTITEYQEHLAQEKGFASSGEYHSFLAQEQGFTSRTEYNGHLLLERGFTSKAEYEQYLAQQNGFLSLGDYQKKMAEKRQQRHLNKELSSLIVKRLAELGQTQKFCMLKIYLLKK